MGLYSDAILKQMGQIGEPITSTSKTTVKPPGPAIDIMQLLMMLMFSGAFQQGDKRGTSTVASGGMGMPMLPAARDMSSVLSQAPATMPTTPFSAGGTAGTGDLASLMKILMSIPGMGGIPGT